MHEEINLLEDFAIIMAVAGLAVILFRRFGQPPILGYLLAGVLVGPFTLPFHLVEDVETIRLLAVLPTKVVYRREAGVAPPMPPCGRE